MRWAPFALLVLVAPPPVVTFDSFVTCPVVFVLAQLLYMLADVPPADTYERNRLFTINMQAIS